jgi:ABC-type antimicrobial peptide transport system permease subunit
MVLRAAAQPTKTGSAIGLAIALLVTKPLAMFLVAGLKTTDPVNYLTVVAVMIATGLVASWSPMRRAVAVDPNSALV